MIQEEKKGLDPLEIYTEEELSILQYIRDIPEEGTIGEGMNSKAQLRYHVTKLGEDIAQIQYIAITKRMVDEALESMKV